MQPLTEDVWAERFAELRPLVLREFPQVSEQDLEGARGDYDRLVELIQRSGDLDADVVRQRLTAVDVDEAGGAAASEGAVERASVAQLRIEAGFSESEHDRIRGLMSKLDRRLNNFPADAVDLELTVNERDTTSQKVTLEAWLPKFPHLAATSKEPALHDALMDVREDLLRQINDEIGKRKDY
jgi:hypothetical protein